MVYLCRPVLAADGMEAVQVLLAEHGMSVIQAIAITRALLGWETRRLCGSPSTPWRRARSALPALREPDRCGIDNRAADDHNVDMVQGAPD